MENYEVVLEHHGVKGMKWGVRRYQNKDGSLTPRGKRRLGIGESISGYFKKRKAESVKKKAAAEKQKVEDEERKKIEDAETKKAAVLKSRSAKALYENADLFTTDELRTAKARLELERDIARLSPEEVDSGQKFADKFIKTSGNIANMVDSGSKMYNNVAKVYNALYGNAHGKSLSLISDKVMSKVDKMKDETERLNAEVAYREAKKKHSGEKSAIERMKEETDKINTETKNIAAKTANSKVKDAAYEYAQSKKMPDDGGSYDKKSPGNSDTETVKAYSSAKGTKESVYSSGQSFVSGLLGGGSSDKSSYGSKTTSDISSRDVILGRSEVERYSKYKVFVDPLSGRTTIDVTPED